MKLDSAVDDLEFVHAETSSGADGAQGWAVSYSDMITQLLVFFIIIVSASKISTVKFESIQKSLRGEQTPQNSLTKIEKDLAEILAQRGLTDSVSVVQDDDGIMMIIKDSLLFGSGDATLSKTSEEKLAPVLQVFRDLPKIYQFVIEGHTDDAPIASQDFSSNWELSSARALAALKLFTQHGIEERRLSTRAYGDQRPLVPNRDGVGQPMLKNRQQNRRVVIRIK